MRLALDAVTVRYGARIAVAGVSLEAARGELLAILGANGSGKSSLLRALAGLQRHAGTVAWDGQPAPPAGAVGYMPQDNAARAALTAFEVVLLGRMRALTLRVAPADLAAAEAALAELGIAGLATRRIGELSGGQRQLVFLAQVLAGDPRVLLLDEPTSALDATVQKQVLALLRTLQQRHGMSYLFISHDLAVIRALAHRVLVLRGGQVVESGETAALFSAPQHPYTAALLEAALLPAAGAPEPAG